MVSQLLSSRLAWNTMPTATPVFVRSNFSMGLSVSLSDETRSQKSKMAAENNVISRISANIHDSNEFLTANPTLIFRRLASQWNYFYILSDVSGSRKSKMAACKPEVLLSQLVYEIETRFPRPTPHLRG
jgi:hypothetical protein